MRQNLTTRPFLKNLYRLFAPLLFSKDPPPFLELLSFYFFTYSQRLSRIYIETIFSSSCSVEVIIRASEIELIKLNALLRPQAGP